MKFPERIKKIQTKFEKKYNINVVNFRLLLKGKGIRAYELLKSDLNRGIIIAIWKNFATKEAENIMKDSEIMNSKDWVWLYLTKEHFDFLSKLIELYKNIDEWNVKKRKEVVK